MKDDDDEFLNFNFSSFHFGFSRFNGFFFVYSFDDALDCLEKTFSSLFLKMLMSVIVGLQTLTISVLFLIFTSISVWNYSCWGNYPSKRYGLATVIKIP